MLNSLFSFSGSPRLTAAVEAYRQGRPVLLLDDEDRENEADIVAAAQNLSIDTMTMMIRDGSGIVCLCLEQEDIDRLGLLPMTANNRSKNRTAFMVSIEAREGVSTGVSASDRVTTIEAALERGGRNGGIVSPGHVFPLHVRTGGVLERRGHTEGSVALARLAGLHPAAVLCELMNSDGTMSRGRQVQDYGERYGLPTLTIAELVAHYQHSD